MTIHDTLFKETFRRPAEAEALLRWVLGPDVFAGIPANRLRLHDPGLRSHHRPRTGDLLYTLPQPPPAPPIFLLLEDKAHPGPDTTWQLFQYLTAILQEHHVLRGRRIFLPEVHIVVVLHGRRRWQSRRSLADLVWPRPGSPRRPGHSPVQLHYALAALTGMTGAQIRVLPLLTLGRVTLFCLQRARLSRDFLTELREWLPELRELQHAADGGRGLGSVLWYVAQAAPIADADWHRFVVRELGNTAEVAMRSAAKRIVEELLLEARTEGRVEGRTEGRAEGRAEGRTEGRMELLRKQLEQRFGMLSARTGQRLRRASTEQLDLWGERLLTAKSLREVFAASE